MTSKLRKVEHDLVSKNSQIKSLEEENIAAKSEWIQTLEEENISIKTELEKVKAEVALKNRKIQDFEEVEQDLMSKNSQIQSLEEENTSAKSELDAIKAEIALKNIKIQDFEESQASWIQILNMESKKSEEALTKMRSQLRKLEQDLLSKNNQILILNEKTLNAI